MSSGPGGPGRRGERQRIPVPGREQLQAEFQKWNENRNRRKAELDAKHAHLRLGELLEGNRYESANVSSVHIIGAPNLREDFLASIVLPAISTPSAAPSSEDIPPTLEDALRTSSHLTRLLAKTDAFSSIIPRIAKSESIYDRDEDVELQFRVKEKSRYTMKTSTELGNGEGSLSIQTTLRSLLGRADVLSAHYSTGTRTRRSIDLNFSLPLTRIDPELDTWFHATAFERENDWTESSSCWVREAGVKGWVLTKMHLPFLPVGTQEFGYEAIRRNVGLLTPRASLSIREAAGTSVKSALSHIYTYDTREPGSGLGDGVYLKTFQELAGLFGGQAQHYKAFAEGQVSKAIRPGLLFSFGCRAGWLYPLSSHPPRYRPPNTAPLGSSSLFPDRFFLGGPTTVRMFKERGMGPHDRTDSLGGDLLYAAGVSVVSDIPFRPTWPVKLHAFINAGRLDVYDERKSLPTQFFDALQNPSLSAGVGLMYKIEQVRVEMNVGVPLVQSWGEKTRKGLQVGLGIDFL